MSSAADELEKYKIQLQQVEAALIAEPNNEELLKLKEDLDEIIRLQEELVNADGEGGTSAEADSSSKSRKEKHQWKVGDRVLAPSKNGQKYVAVIDGISQDKVAITFAGNGVKHMVRLNELSEAPREEKKNYIFQSTSTKSGGPKKEWQLERERRKMRAQKKEQRKKMLDETKEKEKSNWQSFNAKAANKGMKGLKRIAASGSAADGPRNGNRGSSSVAISSRTEKYAFGATNRGNMESLF